MDPLQKIVRERHGTRDGRIVLTPELLAAYLKAAANLAHGKSASLPTSF